MLHILLVYPLGFLEINGFPKVLGCIDGTHIALKVAKEDQHVYRNRKGYDSLNVQAICNASNEITQLTVKWPGSTHDSFMWRNCDLADKFEAGDMPEGWLLGTYFCFYLGCTVGIREHPYELARRNTDRSDNNPASGSPDRGFAGIMTMYHTVVLST